MLGPIARSYKYAYDHSIPWYTTLELTMNCNLKCVHCYNFDRSKPMPKEIKKTPMSSETIKRVIGELAAEGCLYLGLSGGEALVHPHFFDFVKEAKKHHMVVKLKSNGALITSSLAQKIKLSGISEVDISLYGASPVTHDYLTAVEGSFKKTINGVKNLIANQVPVDLKYILYNRNVEELDQMMFVAEEFGCKHSFSTELTKRYDHTSEPEDLRLSSTQYMELLNGPHSKMFRTDNTEGNLQCNCARLVCGINYAGDVYPCIGAPIFSGNVGQSSFHDIWKNSAELNKIRNIKKEDFKECFDCNLKTLCSRSSGSAYVNSGNYWGPDHQACQQSQVKANWENTKLQV